MLLTWFVIAAAISSIPLFFEYSRVTKKYEIIKKPRHRHSHDNQFYKGNKHKISRLVAIEESIKDYEDEEEIEVGFTTTHRPIKVKRVQKKVDKPEFPSCQMQIAETLPASVFDNSDLAENHLPMHEVISIPTLLSSEKFTLFFLITIRKSF